MSTMTPEVAKKLREKFPPSAVGKLPKGGVMLDYVGHAAVTDRLLAIDPTWSWEPMGVDEHGLPATDKAGNLWIKLTVCGVTRIGVGDGPSAKIAVGDAIRNAAMRFGVALDLWSKEELEGSASAAVPDPTPAPLSGSLKNQVWSRSIVKDPALSDEDRRAWIRGELSANGNDMEALLREWAA